MQMRISTKAKQFMKVGIINMFSFSKECFKENYTKEQYLEWARYIKDVAENIVENHLKKSKKHNTGVYSDIELLNSLIPFYDTGSKEYKQCILELKKLGVEFYENQKYFRF